ncbi:MAG: hypothetical protein V8R89_07105 [Alphaproteobacteria bacterium]
MKTTSLWFATAAAVVLTGMTMMTSCSKDDYELPEVIESEVYDEGRAEEVKAKVGTEGTQLSYESWIMVRGITRASFDNKVSVTLNGKLKDVAAVCPVNHWEIGDYQATLFREVFDQRTEGFVTVTDSVLVYKLTFDEFSFEYRLNYEVPVYDDHVTRQVMPYYYYSNLKDNGGRLEKADSYVDGDMAYARRIYRHSISVDFGGQTYEVKAEVTLRRELGPAGEAYIVNSEVIDKSVEAKAEGDGFLSTIMVKSQMSTGEEREEEYVAELPAISERYTGEEVTFNGSISDLKLVGTEVVETGRSYEDGGECVTLERISENCVLHYNGFDLKIPLVHYGASFDNIVLQEEMAGVSFEGSEVRVTSADWDFIESDGNREHYFLTLTVEVKIGGLSVEGIYNGWFVFVR